MPKLMTNDKSIKTITKTMNIKNNRENSRHVRRLLSLKVQKYIQNTPLISKPLSKYQLFIQLFEQILYDY